MTQDRTRAIVEAAEMLAKAVGLHESEDFPGTAAYDPLPFETHIVVNAATTRDALLSLARAIAIPSSPPVPESKLRAVYEAAEMLARSVSLRLGNAQEGDVEVDDSEEEQRAWYALAVALSLPSPQWTRTPPSEPGFWFWREEPSDLGLPRIVARDKAGALRSTRVLKDIRLAHNAGLGEPVEQVGGEWWPVRIEEPPST